MEGSVEPERHLTLPNRLGFGLPGRPPPPAGGPPRVPVADVRSALAQLFVDTFGDWAESHATEIDAMPPAPARR